jgi:membrane-bound serine protease (ClpP class)
VSSPRWCALLALAAWAGPEAARCEIPVVHLDGIVHAVSAAHVVSAIDAADAAGAPLVVLQLNTPGGLDTTMRQIIDRMLAARTPVAVFVAPSGARAASAGFLILVAADVAAMAPGTNTGAAHPVAVTGPMDEVMSKKAAEDAAAYVRSKAGRRGRNPDLAQKAVLESRAFTDGEALDGHLVDLVVQDVPALVSALDGRQIQRFDGSRITLSLRGHALRTVRMGRRAAILAAIATPELLFLFLMGALMGIGAEISHPGGLFPGILGVLCLILFLFASQVIPVHGAGVLLILLAVGLFVAEAKVASHGLLTVAGIVAMILGAMMLVDSPAPEMRVPLRVLLPVAALAAVGTVLLVRLVLQARRRPAVTGEAGLVGQRGVADTDLKPDGWVKVAGERWRGVAEGEVSTGETVTVLGVDGLCVRVRKVS